MSAGGCVHVCPEFEPRVLYANDLLCLCVSIPFSATKRIAEVRVNEV